MQRTIQLLKKHNLLKIIPDELDVELEIPHLAYIEVKKQNSLALLFTNPVNKKLGIKYDIPVLMNVFGSYKALELIFNEDIQNIADEIKSLLKPTKPNSLHEKINLAKKLFSLKNIFPKKLKTKGQCQEIELEIDLTKLPHLKTWPLDGGAFITMGQTYTQSLDGKMQNLGMYRLQVYDKKHLGMHFQIHKDSSHFFHEYKKANKKMPVSVAIGGDPLYIWCGQAPLPIGVFELLLYGFIRKTRACLVKSLTNDIFVPKDADIIIEGFIDTNLLKDEGPFGDHTGYYTPVEPYPFMEVTKITSKKNPIYQSTVVGKPPLEDKYMGYATERIFLPLLQTTTPDLIDYYMPENGVFHNLILAKIKPLYPKHSQQIMHAFWGVGQMSFVKHAIFLNDIDMALNDEKIIDLILNRIKKENVLISSGVCDALDHASPNSCYGGKLGIDVTEENLAQKDKIILTNNELYDKISLLVPNVKNIFQYKTNTKMPICIISIQKTTSIHDSLQKLEELKKYIGIAIFVDSDDNDITNAYMLIWRICNNIDAQRDIYLADEFFCIDATRKNKTDGYERQWPKDTNCDENIIKSLQEKGLIKQTKEFLKHYHV